MWYIVNRKINEEYFRQTLLACEQALHLGNIMKSTRASGTRGETRQRGAGPLAALPLGCNVTFTLQFQFLAQLFVNLIFESFESDLVFSVDKIMWCYHSNETSDETFL